jgi:hypothetical protein
MEHVIFTKFTCTKVAFEDIFGTPEISATFPVVTPLNYLLFNSFIIIIVIKNIKKHLSFLTFHVGF